MAVRKALTEEEVIAAAASEGWNCEKLTEALLDLADHKASIGCPYRTPRGVTAQIRKFKHIESTFRDSVDHALMSGWKAAYPPKGVTPDLTPETITQGDIANVERELFGSSLNELQSVNGNKGNGGDDLC